MKKKLPYLIKYSLNSVFNLLFPFEIEEEEENDDFTKYL
jgi:hypothetical protein